jgi:uncharacterized damage-inducible protein DinB
MSEHDPRYPIGRFSYVPDAALRGQFIADIAELPHRLKDVVATLSADQWSTPYRDGGWSVIQLVHHLADSHMNAFIRFKLALTEDEPTIKPYHEAAWAELADSAAVAPETSVVLLDMLHRRWVRLLESMTAGDFERTLWHPERNRAMTLDEMLALYAWHCRHQLAHILRLVERNGWSQAAPVQAPV